MSNENLASFAVDSRVFHICPRRIWVELCINVINHPRYVLYNGGKVEIHASAAGTGTVALASCFLQGQIARLAVLLPLLFGKVDHAIQVAIHAEWDFFTPFPSRGARSTGQVFHQTKTNEQFGPWRVRCPWVTDA